MSPSSIGLGANTSTQTPSCLFPTNDLITRFIQVFSKHLEREIISPSSSSSTNRTAVQILNHNHNRNSSITSSSTNSVSAIRQVNGHNYDHHHDYLNADPSMFRQSHRPSTDSTQLPMPMPMPIVVPTRKPFYRRLSFKGFKKARFFQRQFSDDLPRNNTTTTANTATLNGHGSVVTNGPSTAAAANNNNKHSKAKLAKIVVECQKEGIVNYLSGENLDGTQKWAKCKLVLVKTVGGYMLEFYSPPKVNSALFNLLVNAFGLL